MKLLAIDTSTSACSVALLNDEKVTSFHLDAPMQQAQRILPAIHDLLQQSQLTLSELDAFAFGRGPGSFTGVRIATSVIQGLAVVVERPVIAVSSLAAVAQAAYTDLGWKNLLVVMDARMQEVYWGAYTVNTQGLVELSGKEHVTLPEKIIAPDGENWTGVGTGWGEYANRIPFHYAQEAVERLPMASAILALAQEKYRKHHFSPASEAVPVYLRDNVTHQAK